MKKLVIFAFCSILAGCATTTYAPFIEISVNALASPEAAAFTHGTYFLAPGQQGVKPGDLEFIEFSEHVAKALSAQGLVRVNVPDTANLVVQLSYAIGDPQTFQSQVPIPVFGQTGIASLNTTGRVIGNTYSSTTTTTPTYGVTGYISSTRSDTYFTRNMRLIAFKPEHVKDGSLQELWKVSTSSVGSSGDLRLVFPYMVKAALPYVGKNPGKAVAIKLPMADPVTLPAAVK